MVQKLSKAKQSSILIVDDTPENLKYLNELLTYHNYDVRGTLDPMLALDVATRIQPDLILLDIKMPKMDGYTLAKTLQEKEEFGDTPIIFISALDDVEDKVKAFDAGGVDYITKPFEEKEVLARVSVHLQLHKSKEHILQLLSQQDYFTKKIMHEMNTPVSVISLNAQTLEEQLGKKPQIDTIKASSKILASIYNELGYLTKKELHTYEPQWIKLLEFISTRIAYFHEIAEVKAVEINLYIDVEFSVYINPIQLERLIDNMLSNAIKYSKTTTEIQLLLGHDDTNYYFSITDEGVGIEDTQMIFEHYYQSSSENIGLGIGLATVKEICEMYDINIEVQSTKDVGSAFTFTFPNQAVKPL